MNCLIAIETSTRSPSVALRTGGRTYTAELSGERPHASDLLPALQVLLAAQGLHAREVQAVFVGTGPGSYTGLRVGCATALGLALGSGAVLLGVPSTEALVFGAAARDSEAGVLIDARAGEVYFAHYRHAGEDVEVISPPQVLKRAALAAHLPAGLPLFADAAALAAGAVEERAADVVAPPLPRADALLALGGLRLAQHGPHAPHEVQPLYLRAFGAQPRKR